MKKLVLLLLILISIPFVVAQLGYDNPNLPKLTALEKLIKTFLELEDTPSSYTSGFCVTVNSDGTALNFENCSTAGAVSSVTLQNAWDAGEDINMKSPAALWKIGNPAVGGQFPVAESGNDLTIDAHFGTLTAVPVSNFRIQSRGRTVFQVASDDAAFDTGNNVKSVTWVPFIDNTYDLGTTGFRWKDLYLAGNILGEEGSAPAVNISGSLGDAKFGHDGFNITQNGSVVISSGNITAGDWLFGKLNFSDVQNHPGTITNATVQNLSLNKTEADLIYLNLSGTNANQNINVSPYNITAGSYFGEGKDLTLARVGSSGFGSLQDLQNLFHSSGTFNSNSTVSFIVLNGDNTFNVTGGSGAIRATVNATDTLFFFDWTASNNIAIALNEVIYVGIEYNAGSPQVLTKSTNSWDSQQEFPLGSVVRDISGVHVQREDHAVGDHATNMVNRLFDTLPFARANREGGLILGTSGLNITVTAGTIWEKLNTFPISAIDTSGLDTFDRYYRDGTGGWFAQEDNTEWNNTHYDDGTGTLNELGNNRWSIEWVYLEVDGEIVTLFGQEQFNSQGSAEGASPPSTAPDRVQIHSRIIGRIIFQKDATSAASTESVFVTQFTVAGVVDHGNLAGLSDDDHTIYLLADATRALTGDWSAGDVSIIARLFNATSWDNVTITESQISDLSHVTDTNATTECGSGLYLSGDGTCDSLIANNTVGWVLNFSIIFSDDWTNVTISESQISDLTPHTPLTNVAFVNNSQIFTGNNTFTDQVNITTDLIFSDSLLNITQNETCVIISGLTSDLKVC